MTNDELLKNSNSFLCKEKEFEFFQKLFRKKIERDKENNGNALFLSLSKEEYTDRWNNNDPYI